LSFEPSNLAEEDDVDFVIPNNLSLYPERIAEQHAMWGGVRFPGQDKDLQVKYGIPEDIGSDRGT
jgi:hypothetical protein